MLVRVPRPRRAGGGSRSPAATPDRRDAHRHAVQERHAREPLEVLGLGAVSRFTFAAVLVGDFQPPLWPQPCGSATTPGVISSRDACTGTVDRRRSWTRAAPRRRPRARAGGVVGLIRSAGPRAAHQQRRVVHPRVVGAQLTHADQPQREVGVAAVRGPMRATSSAIAGGASLRRTLPPRDARGRPARRWDRGAQHDPCGCSRAAWQATGPAAQAEQVAVAAGAQQQVDEALGLIRMPSLGERAQRRDAVWRNAVSGVRSRRRSATPRAPRRAAPRPGRVLHEGRRCRSPGKRSAGRRARARWCSAGCSRRGGWSR